MRLPADTPRQERQASGNRQETQPRLAECVPMSESGKFVLIFGTGHCGTKWLANALNFPDQKMVFFHEKKFELIQQLMQPANVFQYCFDRDTTQGIGAFYDPYWDFMKKLLQDHVLVGDSNSWMVGQLEEIQQHIHVDYAVHLIRNGILTVNSIFLKSHTVAIPQQRKQDILDRYPGICQSNPRTEAVQFLVKWIHTCECWKNNDYISGALGKILPQDRILPVKLEEITSDPENYQTLCRTFHPGFSMDPDSITQIQNTDLNRKITQSRNPRHIFRGWNQIQRKLFTMICGEEMALWGYGIP